MNSCVYLGGLDGIRDQSGLSSAIGSPQNVHFYDPDASIFDIAASYAYHISQSQAFVDGNKRTALQAALVFLNINGFEVETDPMNIFEAMMNLHNGQSTKEAFAKHLTRCSVRKGGFAQFLRKFFRI